MSNGPSLVLRGTIIGSLVVGLMGWMLGGHIKIQADTEVAYAASASTTNDQPNRTESVPAQSSNCQVSSSFPQGVLQWCAIITSFANQTDLSPDLVAAVILQESGGDASAYSASGAVGLMQVMPRDGLASEFNCINGPCFASRPTTEELQDPSYNIEFGTKMLAGLIARLGNLREALKAYGPMNVDYYYADKVLAIYENYR